MFAKDAVFMDCTFRRVRRNIGMWHGVCLTPGRQHGVVDEYVVASNARKIKDRELSSLGKEAAHVGFDSEDWRIDSDW